METTTLRLNNSILGWMLVPSYRRPQPDTSWLNALHGGEWLKMKPIDRTFCQGETVDKAIATVKEVCKSLGYSVSFCGNKGAPTVRLWRKPLPLKPEVISVDLKWSCWSEDESTWEEFSPGTWAKMLNAFTGESGPVTIHTGPRKEIRYGSVTIEKGKASGYFCTNWDECEMLAETLGTECNDGFCDSIPYSIHQMEPGIDWDFGNVKARKFVNLMRKIDQEESELLNLDEREWKFVETCFRSDTV